MPYPSSERLIGCLAKCLPLLCEVDFVLALCLASKCSGCVVIERGVVYSWLLYCPKSLMEVPCVGVLCGQVSGNPSV